MVLNHLLASNEPAAIDAVWNVGVVPLFGPRLGSRNDEVKEQSLWLVGALAADESRRDAMLAGGLVDAIVKVPV